MREAGNQSRERERTQGNGPASTCGSRKGEMLGHVFRADSLEEGLLGMHSWRCKLPSLGAGMAWVPGVQKLSLVYSLLSFPVYWVQR